ncbi:hypothetical protein PYW07_012535 [Mythimna separata]|uniref:Uncharacterized protein n=1 Tax=Mythimna separata TaxID=271217 RepID=A0AAD7Y8Q6_MYTSE|nr:hypothetical protein PYW07_012535 [Mythimna separata]
MANAAAAPPQVKRRWHDDELELLARTEARLVRAGGCASNINQLLHAELPILGRTLDGIKGYRRKETYKSRVQACLADLARSPSRIQKAH